MADPILQALQSFNYPQDPGGTWGGEFGNLYEPNQGFQGQTFFDLTPNYANTTYGSEITPEQLQNAAGDTYILDILRDVITARVKTPKLFKSEQGYISKLKINDCNLRLCVMEYIKGKDIFSLRKTLNENEIKFIAKQAALINSIDIKPQAIYDSWAIVNFQEEFRKTKKYLSVRDLKLIEPLVQEFNNLRIKELPHCFVHGDIIATNVMKDKDKLWIIDFVVANYYPRIQELAVLACNLFFDAKSKTKSENNLNIALEEYQKKIKLTDKELNMRLTVKRF